MKSSRFTEPSSRVPEEQPAFATSPGSSQLWRSRAPTFDEIDLHERLTAKAAALAYFLALNHPFVDGNKRAAHAAMEVFLNLNGLELTADVDQQEALFLDLAAGASSRHELQAWLESRTHPRRA